MIVSRRWVLALAMSSITCTPDDQGGQCATDADCGGTDPLCLFDEPRGTTFCTSTCDRDLDCDDTRFCRDVAPDPVLGGGEGEQSLCIELVRECADQEPCNGLDDDCNGRVDDDCTPLPCGNETQCGAFSCAAPDGAPETICAARPEGAPRSFYGACATGADCPNGVCRAGFCSPFCQVAVRSNALDVTPTCRRDLNGDGDFPVGDTDWETGETRCVEQVGSGAEPVRNACQERCEAPSDCADPLQCVWRRVVPREDLHESVCSVVNPALLPLGADCPDNSVQGDATCQSGLCFFRTCTRFCEGSSDPCSDVGDDFTCEASTLIYQQINNPPFRRDRLVCVPRS